MIRWALLFVVVAARDSHPEESESAGLFLFKLLVFLIGLAVALGELAFYVMSFRRDSVVEFQVYGSQPNVNQPMKMLESERDVGSQGNFHKPQQEAFNPEPQTSKNIDEIANQMFKEAEDTLSARQRRKRRVQQADQSKSTDSKNNNIQS